MARCFYVAPEKGKGWCYQLDAVAFVHTVPGSAALSPLREPLIVMMVPRLLPNFIHSDAEMVRGNG